MAPRKAAQNCTILPWLSAKGDNREKRFIQLGNTFLLSKAFQTLSAGARYSYLCMAMEAAGRREFEFPRTSALKFGIGNSALRRHVDELTSAGFLEIVAANKNLRKPNRYRFALDWKARPP